MDLAVSLEDSLKQPCLCWKGSKDPRTRGFKNGIKYCRRCRTRKKYHDWNHDWNQQDKAYSRKLWTR
jgi:hypothetical protein